MLKIKNLAIFLPLLLVITLFAGCGAESASKKAVDSFISYTLSAPLNLEGAKDILSPTLQTDFSLNANFVLDNFGITKDDVYQSHSITNFVLDGDQASVEVQGEFKCKSVVWAFVLNQDTGWKITSIGRGATTEKEGCKS